MFIEAINTSHIQYLTQQITNLGKNTGTVSQSEMNSLTESLEKIYKEAGEEAGIIKTLYQGKPAKEKLPYSNKQKEAMVRQCLPHKTQRILSSQKHFQEIEKH